MLTKSRTFASDEEVDKILEKVKYGTQSQFIRDAIKNFKDSVKNYG